MDMYENNSEIIKTPGNVLDFFLEKDQGKITYEVSSPLIQESESHFCGFKKFSYASHVPATHNFFSRKYEFKPKCEIEFAKAHARDLIILRSNIPNGILVKGFEGHMELFSALIFGPADTPYEGGVFAFDIKLPEDYPQSPPEFRSFSFKKTQGISNFSRGTEVQKFLFRTWQANHSWTKESSLLDIILSIQSMIAKPYGILTGRVESALVNPYIELTASMSKKFNESVVIFFLIVLVELLDESPFPWKIELTVLLRTGIPRLINRYVHWLRFDTKGDSTISPNLSVPLLPFERTWEVEKLIKHLRILEYRCYSRKSC